MLLKPEKLDGISKDRYRKIIKRSQAKIDNLFDFAKFMVGEIQKKGDKALCKYTKKYDGVNLTPRDLIVTKNEIKEAYKELSLKDKKTLKKFKESVQNYHALQKSRLKSWFVPKGPIPKGKEDSFLGRKLTAFDKVGVYIPGGKGEKGCYPSTAIMAITPAKLVGVKEIIVSTPPKKDGKIPASVLYACDISGADKIIKAGGAQAIAALACGTKTIPMVDIVVGPGNIYVTATKSYVSANGYVAIDFPAGPSEILIIADTSANASYIVSDMFAQAEHDEHACAVLITTSKQLAKKVSKLVDIEIKNSERKTIIEKALKDYGTILIANSLDKAINFCNEFAPEHLEIMTSDNDKVIKKIRNAGLICVGPYSSVAMADYRSGTNHILPTGGAARWASSLGVENFIKRIQVEGLNREVTKKMAPAVYTISKMEGLYSEHGLSIKKRIDNPDRQWDKKSMILKNPLAVFDEKIKKRLLL